MDSDQHDEAGGNQDAGVFGNLPTSRPGTRSPRRKSSAAAKQPPTEEPTPEPPPLDPIADAERVAAATAPRRAKSPTGIQQPAKEDPARDPAAPESEADEAGSGLGDIAWAGVAVAADAATIGVRLASRALERLRDGVDPR